MNFRRVIVLDLASLGIGESSDANRFDSVGADTLGHIATLEGSNFQLPTLSRLGLGNIRYSDPVVGLPPVEDPIGFFGKIRSKSEENSKLSGLREMFDFQTATRTTSVIDAIVGLLGVHSILISDYQSYLSNQNQAEVIPVNTDDAGFKELHQQVIAPNNGLLYYRTLGLQENAISGNRQGCIDSLKTVDQHLARLMRELYSTDLLIITSTFANDPALDVTPTREYLPLIAYTSSSPEGKALGIRRTLADVGATIGEIFGLEVSNESIGSSFLGELK
ncbi:phosphopentomutase [Lentilactobacillus kefiri]|uniref:Phosphopentomutase n=2 Tax=Lentilactobacillus kefiri TaxID=33962 RepID=A0A8E1RM57_LENKE|nr:phosphopentomutase [Lentilactobacillus kefiri]KRL67958.1 phosphopentomutase [Lentilactobacillus parakefiri DSM 10551]KRM53839.1 phosphopentomutase [Lentilactobacillus kefiri DSM 20587 = JCM 5818]MCJ2162589.1 phosphopentomutase [Lentilactobacillus kefiri]MCP9369795.1 phosphopentomutase [Lentilactobacillus kefiri]PAK58807.1 phosphopentomutase [Lentilactobacillus kefiri]